MNLSESRIVELENSAAQLTRSIAAAAVNVLRAQLRGASASELERLVRLVKAETKALLWGPDYADARQAIGVGPGYIVSLAGLAVVEKFRAGADVAA